MTTETSKPLGMNVQDNAGTERMAISSSSSSWSQQPVIALPDFSSYSIVSVDGQVPVVNMSGVAGTSTPLQTVLVVSSPAAPSTPLAATPSVSNTSHSTEQSSLAQENLVGQITDYITAKNLQQKTATSAGAQQSPNLPTYKSGSSPHDRKTEARISTIKSILDKPEKLRKELDRSAKKIRLLQTELLKERKVSACLKKLLENDSILLTEVPPLLKDLIKLHKCDVKFSRRYSSEVLDFGCRVYSVSPAAFLEVQKMLPMPRVEKIRELLRLDRLTAEQGGTLTYPGVAPRSKAVRFTPEQTAELQAYRALNNRPSAKQKEELAKRLGVATNKVKRWFEHRNHSKEKASRASLGSNQDEEDDDDDDDDDEEEDEE